jgi:diguanylate cyclase (GGDEF)-like protein
VNGKLIIDRSVQPTSVLISRVEIILAVSGMLCLVVLVPFLSRILSKGLDKYINEILLKSTELSLLYHVVERLSNTIEMDELKHIVVKIIRELLGADEIHIIMPKDSHEHGGIVWKKSDDKIDRRMAGDDAPYVAVISAWQNKDLNDAKVSDDHKEIYLPIIKNNDRLALIIVTKAGNIFNQFGMGMIRAMGNHIAVAFENALLYQIAITDELTGLYSKRHFLSSMEKKIALYERYGEKLVLLMLDIDDFKKINDTYGHPAGDHILKQIGQAVMNSTRDGDMDFRYGGEEFAVILPATDSAWGVFVAERIRKKIEGTAFTIENITVKLTVSIGVASCPEHAETIKDLIVKADRALYESKRTGKNRVVLSMNKLT